MFGTEETGRKESIEERKFMEKWVSLIWLL